MSLGYCLSFIGSHFKLSAGGKNSLDLHLLLIATSLVYTIGMYI